MDLSYYEIIPVIDKLLAGQVTKRKERRLFDLIGVSPPLENYFFRQARNPKWFWPLVEKDYFSPDKAPCPTETDVKGSFVIPEWNVLQYLEKVSEQVTVPGNEKYVDELLNIIREVTKYHLENEKKLDNYRTWWFFAKILLNIPNKKIPLDVIELIPIWLDSKFDNILPAADISRKLLPKFLDSSNPEDWKKAEKIIESITAIKWKEMPEELRKGFFGKEKEAKTLVDSHWLLEASKVNATKVGEKCSENVIFVIADRLKDIFRGENPQHRCDITYQSNRFWIMVEHLHDFEFNGSVYLVKGIDTIEKDVAAQLGTGAEVEKEKILDFSITDCRNKESFITSLRTKLKENTLFEKINDELDRRFGIFYEGIFSDYSDIWFGSLFSEPSLRIHGTKETLTLILRDITLAKARTDKTTGQKLFREFLGEKYQDLLFKRIVLFVIGKEWERYNETFWQMIENEDVELFDKPYLESELYVLLQDNVTKFKPQQKKKIRTIIEKGTQENLTKEQREKYSAYWKQT